MRESDIHPHVPEEKAHLFTSNNSQSTEYEYRRLIYSLIGVFKPELILETGTGEGRTTENMMYACNKNDLGHIITIDKEDKRVRKFKNRITFVKDDSLEFLRNTDRKFDFCFLDSDLTVRISELQILLGYSLLNAGAVVCIHDTSRLRTIRTGDRDPRSIKFWEDFKKIDYSFHTFEFPLSRGMLLLKLR